MAEQRTAAEIIAALNTQVALLNKAGKAKPPATNKAKRTAKKLRKNGTSLQGKSGPTLADLLGIKPPPPPPTPEQEAARTPRWRATRVVTFSTRRVCRHCTRAYLSPEPGLFLERTGIHPDTRATRSWKRTPEALLPPDLPRGSVVRDGQPLTRCPACIHQADKAWHASLERARQAATSITPAQAREAINTRVNQLQARHLRRIAEGNAYVAACLALPPPVALQGFQAIPQTEVLLLVDETARSAQPYIQAIKEDTHHAP